MRIFLPVTIALFFLQNISAIAEPCSHRNKKRAQQKVTVATPEENDYDIKGLKFDINLVNTSTDISGSVTTYARTAIPNFALYAFELNNVLTVDSVKINGVLYTSIATSGSVRKVSLVNTIPSNTDFTAEVFYHGTAPAGSGQFFTGGMNKVKLASGSEILYTLSDDLYADDWWPCKQSLQDKIDSVSMWVTTDDSLAVGSNGILQQVTNLPANKHRYEWKSNYPVEYYLIAVAVGPYEEYNYYMHFTDGSNDSMLVQNFIYDTNVNLAPPRKAIYDSTGLMIDHFSKLFGRYPFDDEKYGHVMTVLSGGMEHQTMSWMSTQNLHTELVAHELAHQWWGNSVTYGTWEDIWLSEGMATYSEQLFLEHFWSVAAAQASRTQVFNQVMTATDGSVWVDDTTDVYRIFNGRLTYNKGAAVAHMLRHMAPQDSLFFKGLRNYQQQFKYGTAVTADLKTVMEQEYGIALDSFFRQWIYGEGYPTISAKWAQENTVTHVKLEQTTSHGSVAAYHVPVEVRLTSNSGDTTVTIKMNGQAAHFIFLWNKEVTGITIDPDNHVLNRTGTVQNDPGVLSVSEINEVAEVNIYPNPAQDGWHIENLPAGSILKLYSIDGSELWGGNGAKNVFIPAGNLPLGCYLLQVQQANAPASYHKLLH